MGFGQALSGLNAAAQDLDVIGNNVANSKTAGFKSATASFADVYATSRIGLGVQVAAINQRFVSGNVESTGNQYDMAIDGDSGFFRLVSSNGDVMYSRNGQFIKDKDHYIVNAQGQRLTGYPVTINADGSRSVAVGADPVPIQVPVGNIAPQATTRMGFVTNLDSGSAAIPAATAFDPANPNTFSRSSVSTVYDSLGNAHQLTQYFVKRDAATATPPAAGNESVWDVFYTLDGAPMAPTEATGTGTAADPYVWDAASATNLRFNSSGVLTSVGGAATDVVVSFDLDNDPVSPADNLSITLSYATSTSFGQPFNFNPTPNGYTSGEFSSISVDANGTLQAAYTNGETQVIGGLALANFNNVNGLTPIGGNAWRESPSSGQAILGQPGSNGLSAIKGQSIEASNVDMSKELVNMIIAQRTYQANAQTVKTQDQIMQTLISMR